jgi:WD40 repeat protein
MTIKIWDTTKTYPLYSIVAHTDAVRALVLINDKFLASGSQDSTIKLWDLSSYSKVQSWTASTSWIISLAYDPSLDVLASGDGAYMVKVWDSSLWNNIDLPVPDQSGCIINSNYVQPDGLVNYWPFCSSFTDIVTNLTLYNSLNASFDLNRDNTSLSALGLSDGYVQAPSGIYFNGEEHSIMAWVIFFSNYGTTGPQHLSYINPEKFK